MLAASPDCTQVGFPDSILELVGRVWVVSLVVMLYLYQTPLVEFEMSVFECLCSRHHSSHSKMIRFDLFVLCSGWGY